MPHRNQFDSENPKLSSICLKTLFFRTYLISMWTRSFLPFFTNLSGVTLDQMSKAFFIVLSVSSLGKLLGYLVILYDRILFFHLLPGNHYKVKLRKRPAIHFIIFIQFSPLNTTVMNVGSQLHIKENGS